MRTLNQLLADFWFDSFIPRVRQLWRHVVLFKLLSLWMKSYGVTIQMKPLQQYFCMVPFVFQYFTK